MGLSSTFLPSLSKMKRKVILMKLGKVTQEEPAAGKVDSPVQWRLGVSCSLLETGCL